MKYLVTGVTGQLGYDVVKELLKEGREVIATGRKDNTTLCSSYVKLDINNYQEVKKVIKDIKPAVVIHCAAWTNVDGAEDNIEEVFKTNYGGTKNIALGCKEVGAKMIYISTDYVFNGKGVKPFREDDKKEPLNVYGLSKSVSEDLVMNLLDKYYIVRISWVFGINGKNFVKTMIRLANSHDKVNVISDQVGRPTYTKDLAKLLIEMSLKDKYGVYHVSNEGEYISWYQFTKEIYKLMGINTFVNPVTTEEYELSKAQRPFNSRLDTSKLEEKGFNKLPDWRLALKDYLEELKKSDSLILKRKR